jgi:hypothetical protein
MSTVDRLATIPQPVNNTLSNDLRLVLERVRLLARRRAAWLDYLLKEADASSTPLDDRDSLERERAWFLESTPEINARLAAVEKALNDLTDSRLVLLRQIFSLTSQEIDLLQICLALVLDPTLSPILAYLHGHAARGYVTEDLMARLLGIGRCLVWEASSPLRLWRLVQIVEISPGEPAMLVCDRQIRDWLLGHADLHASLVGRTRLQPPLDPPENWPVARVADFINRVITSESREPVCVQVLGIPGSGRRTFAACVAKSVGMSLLCVDADIIAETDWEQVFVYAQRQAFLEHAALAWYGENLSSRRWPQSPTVFPVQFIVLAPEHGTVNLSGLVTNLVRMPPLTVDERLVFWQRYLPSAASWKPADLDWLATRYRATPGEITAAASALAGSAAEAAAHLRERQRDRLGRLAQQLDCPFTWNDLVVGENLREALEDFAFEARERVRFWEQPQSRRLFPHGRGLAALFFGPPGTGKTMAAQVLAAALGLDLFRVDLSAVVSKYVGETSQNLERILSRADQMDIVLFFDEADALFGKRTEIKDAHDRFANTDTNYLLQAIENYSGIVVLATNKKANIDPAFIRRLRYVLEYPAPDEEQRLQIWLLVITQLTNSETSSRLSPSLKMIAKEIPVTGAQIKFSILAALFIAQRERQMLRVEHLLRGLKRELLKEGRSLSERELERLRK